MAGIYRWNRIQISTESNFATLAFDMRWVIGGASTPQVLMDFNLRPNTAYFWRVASRCANDELGPFSQPASFRTSNVIGPFVGPPAMIAPVDGARQLSLEVNFAWDHVFGATRWQLRIYDSLPRAQNDDQWHHMPYMGSWSVGWFTADSDTLRSGGTYYWRVVAGTDAGWGPLSPVRSFTVGVPAYSISGRVMDSSGHGIPGVTVWAGFPRNTTTDANGDCTLTSLPAGTYNIRPSKDSYIFEPPSLPITVPQVAASINFTGYSVRVKLLYVPLKWHGTQAAFDAEADLQSHLFFEQVPLGACPQEYNVTQLNVVTQNFTSFACPDDGLESIRSFVQQLGINPAEYTPL